MLFLQKNIEAAYHEDDIIFTAIYRGAQVSLTRQHFINAIQSTALYLKNCGVKPGNTVMTGLSHNYDWNIIESAILSLGGIHVPLPPDNTDSEISDKIALIEPDFLLSNSRYYYDRFENLLNSTRSATKLIRYIPLSISAIGEKKILLDEVYESNLNDLAVILFTSGSTKKSKAVALSYKNILTSICDFSATDIFDDVEVCLDILHHSFSGGRKVNYSAVLRGKRICYANRTWSMVENIIFYDADLVTCVPYLVHEILVYLRQYKEIKSLRKIICGGAELDAAVISEFKDYGIIVYNVYGLTETASLCSYNTNRFNRPGSVGKLSEKIQYRLNDKHELLLRGDCVFEGYYAKGDLLKATNEDGWFNTGDIARVDDDGYLFILGRTSGIVKSQKGKFIS